MLTCDGCGVSLSEADAVRSKVFCPTCAAKAKAEGPEVCDFCSTPEPEWGFPTRSFVDAGPVQAPVQGHEVAYVSVEDWAACTICHDLIVAGDAEGLLTRSLTTAPGGDASGNQFMRFALRGFQAQFFANRDGPPYRHAKPSEVGCWVDGHWGQYGMTQVIAIARERGWQLDQKAIDLAAAWTRGDPEGDLDAVVDIADEAEEWLNDKVAPRGHRFGWHEGEFFFEPMLWWEEADA